jgi:protein-tyrosine phosphatase
MFTKPHWIDGPWPGRLAISARPRGGDWLEDEMAAWRRAGIDTVVSMLTTDEVEDLDLQREQQSCQVNSIQFRSFPIVDRNVPGSEGEAIRLIEQLEKELAEGKNVVVHCRQGIGRSGLIAAGVLVWSGLSPSAAVERVSTARRAPIPDTPEQLAWISHLAATITAER